MSELRKIRYQVAASLDGFIAGLKGEYDWIPMDEEIDFGALFAQFDTILVGRETYRGMVEQGNGAGFPGLATVVCSRTMTTGDVPDGVVLSHDAVQTALELKAKPGKEIWLFGGGTLCRELLAAGLVDTIEIAVVPVLLTQGIPVLPPMPARQTLRLEKIREYPRSGIVMMTYGVMR